MSNTSPRWHLVSTTSESVSAAAKGASASGERSRSVSGESWGAAKKSSAVNRHDYKRRVVRFNYPDSILVVHLTEDRSSTGTSLPPLVPISVMCQR